MRSTSAVERYLPVAYFGIAMVMVVALLPTALRPPQPPPPTSAEFSPDAPPDDDQEVILSELSRGTTATAGGLVEEGTVGPGGEIAAPEPLIELAPRRGTCFGNPPRQTESLYSAPCAPAWMGDNLGATSQGVTATHIQIGAVVGSTGADYDGPLREPHLSESDTEVHLRTWQSYFNERFELYGRSIRLIIIRIDLVDDAPTARSKIRGANAQWPMFGIFGISTQWPAIEESILQGIIVMEGAAENPHSIYERHHPYFYSFLMDSTKITRIHTEIMCKQLAGKPPEFNNRADLTFNYSAPRVFGLILYEDEIRSGSEGMINEGLSKCGEKLAVTVKHNLYDSQDSVASAITRMRSEGVTTVLLGGDAVTPIAFTRQASSQAYFPEWWNFGAGGMHTNGSGQDYDQQQWQHALGAFYTEIPRPAEFSECAREYQWVNTDNSAGQCGAYRMLQMFANGIQGAGPELNPQTFFEGLKSVPCRPPEPKWSIGGCFGVNNFTYAEYQALVWWDPDADGGDGAYRHMLDGQRFKEGEIPTEPLPWFEDGITTPEDPRQPN